MNLVMLSGNSLRNRDWIQVAERKLTVPFQKTYVQQYAHWINGDEWIDLPHEQLVLGAAVESLSPYGIFAKSIGTVLSVQSIAAGLVQPKFLLLMGIPLDYIQEHYQDFATDLTAYGGPVIILQNNHDPVGDGTAVREYLGDLPDTMSFVTTIGETHDYEDYDFLQAKLELLVTAGELV